MQMTSVVEYFGAQNGFGTCGYCRSDDNVKFTHGMWAHSLTAEDYNDLINRGWRRSGEYLYKPTMERTCCPQYTIRCDASAFYPSKSQKGVMTVFRQFIKKGEKPTRYSISESESIAYSIPQGPFEVGSMKAMSMAKKETLTIKKIEEKPEKKPPVRLRPYKKKYIRRQRALKKLAAKGIDEETAERIRRERMIKPKTLEDRLAIESGHNRHKFELRLVRSSNPPTEHFLLSYAESFSIYCKYRTVIHGYTPAKLSHSQYRRFLCNSPISHEPVAIAGHPGYGSFHQQYLLNGRIIAVGVIDILPNCVSSKYLYYDPDYAFLTLGTYTALREIAFVRELSKLESKLHWYYMGYYIHSCAKMRYKAAYRPSYLLCPESANFLPFEYCIDKLSDIIKYARFSDTNAEDDELKINVDEVRVVYDRKARVYADLKTLTNRLDDSDEISEYAKLVGRTCAERMLLYRV